MAETGYEDRYWSSRDGLKLHYRDYPGSDARPPLLCLPGLTRNARDFEALALRHAGDWRVICPEMRGRGESEYAKDAETYNPLQYVDDVTALIEEAGIDRFVAVGTSLGGMLTMLLATTMPDRIAAAIINDLGPVVEPAGLARIKGYVGQGRNFPTWVHAARGLAEVHGIAFPDYELADWLETAKRLMTVSSNGRIVFDYDMRIATPLEGAAAAPAGDLWAAFDALATRPVLVVRGELSDILSASTLAEMERRPAVQAVTVNGVGHAPMLDEPEAAEAIDAFLAELRRSGG